MRTVGAPAPVIALMRLMPAWKQRSQWRTPALRPLDRDRARAGQAAAGGLLRRSRAGDLGDRGRQEPRSTCATPRPRSRTPCREPGSRRWPDRRTWSRRRSWLLQSADSAGLIERRLASTAATADVFIHNERSRCGAAARPREVLDEPIRAREWAPLDPEEKRLEPHGRPVFVHRRGEPGPSTGFEQGVRDGGCIGLCGVHGQRVDPGCRASEPRAWVRRSGAGGAGRCRGRAVGDDAAGAGRDAGGAGAAGRTGGRAAVAVRAAADRNEIGAKDGLDQHRGVVGAGHAGEPLEDERGPARCAGARRAEVRGHPVSVRGGSADRGPGVGDHPRGRGSAGR